MRIMVDNKFLKSKYYVVNGTRKIVVKNGFPSKVQANSYFKNIFPNEKLGFFKGDVIEKNLGKFLNQGYIMYYDLKVGEIITINDSDPIEVIDIVSYGNFVGKDIRTNTKQAYEIFYHDIKNATSTEIDKVKGNKKSNVGVLISDLNPSKLKKNLNAEKATMNKDDIGDIDFDGKIVLNDRNFIIAGIADKNTKIVKLLYVSVSLMADDEITLIDGTNYKKVKKEQIYDEILKAYKQLYRI